jgi:DNA-directed RNA polymerase subunit E'
MYRVLTVSDVVSVPPSFFSLNLKDAVEKIIREKYERKVDPANGVILRIWNIHDIEGGEVIVGDGSAHYNVKYNVLTYLPEQHEIIEGPVTEVLDFGIFVSTGPFDGLIHLSQIANEFISFDRKAGSLVMKNSKHSIKKGDIVRAKIVTVSLKPTIPETKIALTMKGGGLGKLEWLSEKREKNEEVKKEKAEEKEEKKEKVEKKEKKQEKKK